MAQVTSTPCCARCGLCRRAGGWTWHKYRQHSAADVAAAAGKRVSVRSTSTVSTMLHTRLPMQEGRSVDRLRRPQSHHCRNASTRVQSVEGSISGHGTSAVKPPIYKQRPGRGSRGCCCEDASRPRRPEDAANGPMKRMKLAFARMQAGHSRGRQRCTVGCRCTRQRARYKTGR